MIIEENGSPKLPSGWIWTSLRELYDIVGGGTPSTAVKEYWNGEIPWITSADIHGPKDIRPRKKISRKAIENSTTNLVPPGSLIVVTRVGLGKIAIADEPLCFSQDSQGLVGINSLLDPRYALYYLSMAVQIFKYENRGTTISGVTKKQLGELPFPLAPMSEQQKIVEKIEELFTQLEAGVEELTQARAQLKRYRQAVLKSAVTGKLTKEWREAHQRELEPASELLVRILKERREKWESDQLAKMEAAGKTQDTNAWKKRYKEPALPDAREAFGLPSCWTWATLEQLSDETRAITYGVIKLGKVVAEGVPTLRSSDVRSLQLDLRKVKRISKEIADNYRRTFLQGNEILMTVRGTLGGVVAVPPSCVGYNISREVAMIALIEKTMAQSLSILIASPLIQNWLIGNAKGIAYTGINIETLKAMPIPLAPIHEQRVLAEQVDYLLSIEGALSRTIEDAIKQAGRTRQSILKQAFEGKLVPHDPNYEPAELLLERIKIERAKREAEKLAAKPKRQRFAKKRAKRKERAAA